MKPDQTRCSDHNISEAVDHKVELTVPGFYCTKWVIKKRHFIF